MGIIDTIKHQIHPETNDPEDLERAKHAAMNSHEREEQRADALIAQRENEEHVHPNRTGDAILPTTNAAGGNLSSLPHRGTLEEAAHHQAPGQATHPDLEGVTHIPESQLPVRHERMENTATRPADPNDIHSMNGLPDNWSTAGDDRAI